MKFMGFKIIFIIPLSLMGSVVNSKETNDCKLPTNFKPVSYELNVDTHLEDKFMFEGVVSIFITCVEATDTIVLHSNCLNIDTKSVVVANNGENVIQVSSVSFDSEKQFMHVKSTVNFQPGDEYVLTIPFTGNLTDELTGYYRSSYVDKENNQTRWLAVTQFEPAYARGAFPCFDEPAYKAIFKIRLGHKKELNAISNMKFTKQINCPSKSDYVVDEFEESVPMSTYLVAYMVSDFVYTEADCGNDQVKFRIISRKDSANQTGFPISLGPKILKYYEDYYDEKFPLHKQDMAAIPDFSLGAMENFGLVTYRERFLLIDLDVANMYNLHQVAVVVTHELAHQWFGNLVTMKWWNDLWLNEGFASYVGSRGVDFLFPEWNSFRVDIVENFICIMDLDSLESSHPVSVTVENPDEIEQIFDAISYKKGSFLLHMMNAFLGEVTFKQGIRNYIHKHKYSNAEQDDLWSALTEEAHCQGSLDKNLTVKQIMDTWTLQTGYPVLNVVRDYSAGTVTLSQERYLTIKSNGTDNKTCWWIPITMITSGDFNQTNTKSWLNCENNNYTTPLAKDNEWVIYNLQMTGLYRVLYDTRNWMAIICTLNDPTKYDTIPLLNRVQLIYDSLSFSKVGDLDYEITFQLLKYLKHEIEFTPWYAAFKGLSSINDLLKRTPKYVVFQNYMQRMLSCVYSKFRNMNDKVNGYENIKFQTYVISKACGSQIKDCTQQALDLFRKWMKITDPDNNNILPIELKRIIYCKATQYGDVDEWNFLLERYQFCNLPDDKDDMLNALGCSSNKLLLQRILNLSLDNSIIRKQDAFTVFYSVAVNDAGFSIAKEFLYSKIADIYKLYQPQGEHLGSYVKYIGSQMNTKEELEEFQSFIDKYSHYLKEADLAVNQTIETIKGNIEWMSKFYNKIVSCMEQY